MDWPYPNYRYNHGRYLFDLQIDRLLFVWRAYLLDLHRRLDLRDIVPEIPIEAVEIDLLSNWARHCRNGSGVENYMSCADVADVEISKARVPAAYLGPSCLHRTRSARRERQRQVWRRMWRKGQRGPGARHDQISRRATCSCRCEGQQRTRACSMRRRDAAGIDSLLDVPHVSPASFWSAHPPRESLRKAHDESRCSRRAATCSPISLCSLTSSKH